jgi:putative DNA primase/helicase
VILTDYCTYDHYHFTGLETLVGEIHIEMPKPELPAYTPRVTTVGSGLSPLDDWEARSDWESIPGWPFELAEIKGYERRWLRIGSSSGAKWSATTGHATDRDRLYCWTPETIFEPRKPYNMQAAYVLLTQGSLSSAAFSQASRELRAQGFGGELPKLDYAPDALSLVRPAAQMPVAVQAVDEQQPAQAAVVVQANEALPVLGHDGLPEFSDDVYRSQPWDDMGLVSMYSSAFCRALRYVNAMDEWRVWNGQRWVRDDLQLHQLASRKLATGLRDAARQAEREQHEHAKEMKGAASKLATMGKVMSLPKLARTDRCMSSTPKDYDQHKYLVTVENGTLNLKTGVLGDFDPDLMLTKKIKAVYDPAAEGPRTLAFLHQIQPDAEVLAYMQRLVGATVLGNADERVLPIIHGASGSGKSAFLEMLYHVLADFAAVADPTTLMPQPDNYQGPSEKLHSLMGTRFVKMSELPENASLNQALVKSITGSDTQKTRPLYGHPVEWDVEYVVWMATNNLPKITSTDGAIWKRVKPIHFPNVFVNEDGSVKSSGDRDLGRQLAREEGSFILNWIMQGVVEYLDKGLAEPAQIGAWLTGYRDEMDTTRQFMAEAQEEGRVKVEETQTIPARDLYRIYLAWAADAQIKYPLSAQTFKQRMQVNGYDHVRVTSGMVWKGIGVMGFLGQAQTPSGQGNLWMGRQRN